MRKQLLSYKMGEFIGKRDNEQYIKPSDIGTKPERNLLSDKERILISEQNKSAKDKMKNKQSNKQNNKDEPNGFARRRKIINKYINRAGREPRGSAGKWILSPEEQAELPKLLKDDFAKYRN